MKEIKNTKAYKDVKQLIHARLMRHVKNNVPSVKYFTCTEKVYNGMPIIETMFIMSGCKVFGTLIAVECRDNGKKFEFIYMPGKVLNEIIEAAKK